jgi:hypothetical protein
MIAFYDFSQSKFCITANEQGLALLGYLKKRQSTTEAQYFLKVEVNN